MFPLQKAIRKAKNPLNGGLLPCNVLYPYTALVSVSYITYFFCSRMQSRRTGATGREQSLRNGWKLFPINIRLLPLAFFPFTLFSIQYE